MTEHTEAPRAHCDVYLMINEDGEYVAIDDPDALTERYDDCVGGTPVNVRTVRTVRLTLSVPLPRGVEASAVIPHSVKLGDALAVTVQA